MPTKKECELALKKINERCQLWHTHTKGEWVTEIIAPIGFHFDGGLHGICIATALDESTEHWNAVLKEIKRIKAVEMCNSEKCCEWDGGCLIWGDCKPMVALCCERYNVWD